MRTTTNGGLTFKYPDTIGFVFNPCIMTISGTFTTAKVTAAYGGRSVSMSVDSFGSSAIAEFGELVQALFDDMEFKVTYSGVTDTEIGRTITFNVVVDGSTSISFSTYYIWGGLQRGETYNGYKKLTWFTKYPFTFGVYANGAATVVLNKNGSSRSSISLSSVGVYNIAADELNSTASYYDIEDGNGALKQATFDLTYDLTFSLTSQRVARRIVICNEDYDEPVYLRWIDRQGFYQYYLFKKGDESRAVASDGEFIRNNLQTWDELYGYYGANGRRQGYSREDEIAICAPLVDQDTFDLLQDLTSSPVVDLYMGDGKWMGVTIKAGSYTKTIKPLQDFICYMVRPAFNIQQL